MFHAIIICKCLEIHLGFLVFLIRKHICPFSVRYDCPVERFHSHLPTFQNCSIAVVGKDMNFTIYDDDDVLPYLRSIEGEERRPAPPEGPSGGGGGSSQPPRDDGADQPPRDPEPDVAMETQ